MTLLQDNYRWYRQRVRVTPHRGVMTGYPPKMALAMARADVAKGTKRYPRGCVYAGQWQALDAMPRHASRDSRAYYCDAWPIGWRDLGDAADVVSLRHTGWYEDDIQESKCKGRVLQLPARDGVAVYVPGIYSTGSDGVTLYPLDRYDDKEDCARAADGYAERAASIAREYNEAWQAGSRAADYWERADGLRSDIMLMTSDLRTARRAMAGYRGDLGAAFVRLCDAGRNRVAELLDQMTTLRRKRDDLRDQWGGVDGFAEGFGR